MFPNGRWYYSVLLLICSKMATDLLHNDQAKTLYFQRQFMSHYVWLCYWLYLEAFKPSFEYGKLRKYMWSCYDRYCYIANKALLRANFVLLTLNVALLKYMDCVWDFQIRIYFHTHFYFSIPTSTSTNMGSAKCWKV